MIDDAIYTAFAFGSFSALLLFVAVCAYVVGRRNGYDAGHKAAIKGFADILKVAEGNGDDQTR